MDNLNMELPRKLDAATIAALFPDLDAVKSRVANWLRFPETARPRSDTRSVNASAPACAS